MKSNVEFRLGIVEDARVERTSDDNRNVFAHADRQDLLDGGLIEKRVAAGDEKAVEGACLSEIDQHLIDLSADAGGSDDPLMPQLGENRIGLLNRLLDVAHSARKLDDVVDVGDVDALEPEPLPALHQRLPRGRRAIVVDAAQRARRPTLRKVDGFGEGIFWCVRSQQSADFGRDDVVACDCVWRAPGQAGLPRSRNRSTETCRNFAPPQTKPS